MSVVVVVGTQWGDEGKGKIIDVLTKDADVIARYQGGHNAGHTVMIGEEEFVFHLIPTGILHRGKICILGNGVVIDPCALINEIKWIREKGIEVDNNLFISDRAHLVLPYHQIYDIKDEKRRGDNKIGTTGRGIGPSYTDKIARIGIRMADYMDKDLFYERLKTNISEKNLFLVRYYGHEGFKFDEIFDRFMEYRKEIEGYITDTNIILKESISQGKNILCEGAQGTMLDIDFGIYPFVTSSNSTVGGVCTGLGIAPGKIDRVIGVVKAYTTRVGEGPFPTELSDSVGMRLRDQGKEYGATTGRPRRCGWFDAVVVRYAAWINGIDRLALTKLDVLDRCEKIYICTGYQYNGKILKEFPSSLNIIKKCQPIYKEMDGWIEDIRGIDSFDDLPENAKRYIEEISNIVETDLSIISTGQRREETILLEENSFLNNDHSNQYKWRDT
ncbi:MAG: adenylosuccinate synthase [Nitrospinae bacterium]|nr:adenylosuccinate synthase [Nitrospinota bacterium]